MGKYRCTQCGQTYSRDEFLALDRKPLNPDDEDPKRGSGYEGVCECGAAFHTDKWQLTDEVNTEEGEIRVSTVGLTIPHGPDHNQWYETCIFHDSGSQVTDRYHDQQEAEDGHRNRVDQLEQGAFEFEPRSWSLVLGGEQ